MKPAHANTEHPANAHYNPTTDDYPDTEEAIERLWREQGGTCPETGRAWLTPRMERNAAKLAEELAEQDRIERTWADKNHW